MADDAQFAARQAGAQFRVQGDAPDLLAGDEVEVVELLALQRRQPVLVDQLPDLGVASLGVGLFGTLPVELAVAGQLGGPGLFRGAPLLVGLGRLLALGLPVLLPVLLLLDLGRLFLGDQSRLKQLVAQGISSSLDLRGSAPFKAG